MLIRFPQERCSPSVDDYRAEPCTILILPVVRIERDVSPILGRRQTRRCRDALAELQAAIAAQEKAGDLST